MKRITSYRRPALLTLAALLLFPALLIGSDRPPAPVADHILRSPKPENLTTLVGPLRGSGCQPKHSDAIVDLGCTPRGSAGIV